MMLWIHFDHVGWSGGVSEGRETQLALCKMRRDFPGEASPWHQVMSPSTQGLLLFAVTPLAPMRLHFDGSQVGGWELGLGMVLAASPAHRDALLTHPKGLQSQRGHHGC